MSENNAAEAIQADGFGAYLQRQRELRGFTLEEIAEQTKISLRALRALEAEDWDVLPADVYVKGFIRCYAETIGLDPNEALIRYEKALGDSPRRRQDILSSEKKYVTSKKRIPLGWVVGLLLVILIVIGGYIFFKHSSHRSGELDFSTITTPPLKEKAESGMEGGFQPGLPNQK